jgi:hypothetical protein
MKFMKFIVRSGWLPIFLFVFVSCTGKIKREAKEENYIPEDRVEDEIIHIDPRTFEDNILTLRSFVDEVRYIPLSDKIKIGTIRGFKISSKAIYIVSDESNGGEGNGIQQLIRFNRNGDDPVMIGKVGRGPEEYLLGSNFAVDEQNNRIYINGKVNTIMVYDTTGSYLREFRLQDPDIRFSEIELLSERYLLVPVAMRGARSATLWNITDTLGHVVSGKTNTTPSFETRIGSNGGTWMFNGNLSYWVDYNDTIFSIKPDFTYDINYILTPGDHRKPKEDIPVTLDLPERLLEYFSPHFFIETENYLVCRYNFKGTFWYVFIDKRSLKTSSCSFKISKDETGGIVNDLDGGLEFSPEVSFEEGDKEFLAGFIHPFSLKSLVASDAFKGNSLPARDKKDNLIKLANSLDENDNPVLMIVTLKND